MMKQKRFLLHTLVAFIFATALLSVAPQTALAEDSAFDSITQHLKLHYSARRVHIPFFGLARFVVGVAHPAGVKSIKVAIFEDLKFSSGSPDAELNLVMSNALGAEWQPLVRVRERSGEQTYIYANCEGKDLRLMVVNIDQTDAVVARVKIDPQKLSEFINNPKILGISLR